MRKPGFTVVEVVIVTLFITFCVYTGRWGYSWYVRSSRASAAEELVSNLVTAQKAYFAKHGGYVSIHGAKLDAFPKEVPADGLALDALPKEFSELGTITAPASPFFFRVAVLAGTGEAPADLFQGSELSAFPAARQPWFYIVAFADQDGDGEFSKIEASSWDNSGVVSTSRTE